MPKYMTKNRLIAEKFLAASEADMKQNQQLQSNLKTNINLVCLVNKGMSLPECLKEYLAANPISDLFQIGLLPRNYVEILIQQKKIKEMSTETKLDFSKFSIYEFESIDLKRFMLNKADLNTLFNKDDLEAAKKEDESYLKTVCAMMMDANITALRELYKKPPSDKPLTSSERQEIVELIAKSKALKNKDWKYP